jgi:hypothetical protein
MKMFLWLNLKSSGRFSSLPSFSKIFLMIPFRQLFTKKMFISWVIMGHNKLMLHSMADETDTIAFVHLKEGHVDFMEGEKA